MIGIDIIKLFKLIEEDELEEIKANFEKLSIFDRFSLVTAYYAGMNSLHLCCKHNCLEILKYLVHQLRPSQVPFLQMNTEMSETCLMIGNLINLLKSNLFIKLFSFMILKASLFGNYEIVSYLLLLGVNVNQISNTEQSALHFAAINGNYEVFKLLLDNKAELINDKYKQSPLFYAASNGNQAIVELIIERGLCTREETIFSYELLGCTLIRWEKFDKGVLIWKKSLVERLVFKGDIFTPIILIEYSQK